MIKWDIDLILMSDEEFAYVTGLTREKIEQMKQKENEVEK